MDAGIKNLLGGWELKSSGYYLVFAALLSFGVRVVLSLFKTLEYKGKAGFRKTFNQIMGGFSTEPKTRDYWLSFTIGFIELCALPIAMRTENWIVIPGWIALKLVPGWKVWTTERQAYLRFLLSVMLIIVLSYWMATEFVTVIDVVRP